MMTDEDKNYQHKHSNNDTINKTSWAAKLENPSIVPRFLHMQHQRQQEQQEGMGVVPLNNTSNVRTTPTTTRMHQFTLTNYPWRLTQSTSNSTTTMNPSMVMEGKTSNAVSNTTTIPQSSQLLDDGSSVKALNAQSSLSSSSSSSLSIVAASNMIFPTDIDYMTLRRQQNWSYAEQQLVIGVKAARNGDEKTAAISYQHGLDLVPKHVDLLVAYGALLANQGQYEKSTQLLSQAISLDSTHPNARNYLQQVNNARTNSSTNEFHPQQSKLEGQSNADLMQQQQQQQQQQPPVSTKHLDTPRPLVNPSIDEEKDEEDGLGSDSQSRRNQKKRKHSSKKKSSKKDKKKHKERKKHHRDQRDVDLSSFKNNDGDDSSVQFYSVQDDDKSKKKMSKHQKKDERRARKHRRKERRHQERRSQEEESKHSGPYSSSIRHNEDDDDKDDTARVTNRNDIDQSVSSSSSSLSGGTVDSLIVTRRRSSLVHGHLHM